MLLPRFISYRRSQVLAAAMLALLFAGCGGSSPVKSDNRQVEKTGAAADGSVVDAVIPPVAMTLFEQATASMASGDFLDAELRFKEFLLQYRITRAPR